MKNISPKKWIDSDIIPPSLPLLDYLNTAYKFEYHLPFLDYKILAVQHLLGASVPFFAMFEKGGAKSNDIYIIGKAYSSHPIVVETLQNKGYHLEFDDVFSCALDESYESILEKRIAQVATNIFDKIDINQKWLIIDDGAKAIRLLHSKYAKFAKQFVCVEQTSRGARTVRTLQLLCPVIDVARSDTKTLLESPMIADAMVEEFMLSLKLWQEAGVYKIMSKRVLLLGYGFIGENVASRLSHYGFNIIVFDTNASRLQKAQQDGFVISKELREVYPKVDLLVGCSGIPVIPKEDFGKLQPGTLLVNMASTDIEFSAWNLRTQGKVIYQRVLPTDLQYLKKYMPLSWRSLYEVSLKNTYLYLANGGFPTDFSGKINPVPSSLIQLTSSLLLGGALQAISETEPKLVELDTVFQNEVVINYLNL